MSNFFERSTKYGQWWFLGIFILIIVIFIIVFISGIKKNKKDAVSRKKLVDNNKFVLQNRKKIEDELNSNSDELEKARTKSLIALVIVILCVVLSIIFIKNIFVTVVIGVIGMVVISLILAKYQRENSNKYNEVVKKILHEYDNNLEYNPNGGFSIDEYYSCYFPEQCDRFGSEDLIINRKNGFCYSDIIVESEHEDDEGNTSYYVEYCGSLARMNIKNMNCRIFLGSTRGTLVYKRDNLKTIKFENDEFNKLLRACTDNELMAYKLLTPDVMEEFVNIKNNTYGDIDIRIISGYLYIRFQSGGTFDSTLFNKEKEKENLCQSIAVLEEVMHTMEKVKKIIDDKDF